MGSRTFDGVRLPAYPLDHLPIHIHGEYAETEVILELDIFVRKVRLAVRRHSITPLNAKRSDVHKISHAAGRNIDALLALWKAAHA